MDQEKDTPSATRMALFLPKSLREKLKAHTKKTGYTMSETIRLALERYLHG